MKYQLVTLGPGLATGLPLLQSELEASFQKLGLDPASFLEIVDSTSRIPIEPKGLPVGVWFGTAQSASAVDLLLLDRLLSWNRPVIPLVEDQSQFGAMVPSQLAPINGRQWDDNRIPGDIIRLFRLTREGRRAFISYRRKDAQPVANQLFDALSMHGYIPFLDVASIESGVEFQEALHDRLADIDVIVFLDSPTAPMSTWILDELVMAAHLGLSVLQVVWPGQTPYALSALNRTFSLRKEHFVNDDYGSDGEFKGDTVVELLSIIESERIESIASRRRHVVGEFLSECRLQGDFDIVTQPMGPIEICSKGTHDVVAWAMPFVGLPDGWTVHREHMGVRDLWESSDYDLNDLFAGDPLARDILKYKLPIRIIYDSLGVRADWLRHLEWLGRFLPAKTLPIDSSRGDVKHPIVEWLDSIKAGGGQ